MQLDSHSLAKEKRFDWPVCDEAEELLLKRIDAFLSRNSFATELARRMEEETGTLFFDWIDHLILPGRDERPLVDLGFVENPSGETSDGREVYRKHCVSCHRIGNEGHELGPSLASVRTKSAEEIMEQILDPNRLVDPQFFNYKIFTIDGHVADGLLDRANETTITLRRALGETETILRANIQKIICSGTSLMPEGLESGIDLGEMADLVAFCRTSPESEQKETAVSREAAPSRAVERSEFRAGTAEVKITPEEPGLGTRRSHLRRQPPEESESKRTGRSGCGGDINPNAMGKIDFVPVHGKALADAVEPVYAHPERMRSVRGPLATAFREIELPLDKAPSREFLQRLLEHQSAEHRRHAREMLKQIDAGRLPASVPYPILVWRFGSDLTLAALSGEVCVDYALRLKRGLGAERLWVAGYANAVPCYIPSDRVLAEGGYEAGWGREFGRAIASGSILRYGWPVPFAPGLEDRIVSAVRDLVNRSRE